MPRRFSAANVASYFSGKGGEVFAEGSDDDLGMDSDDEEWHVTGRETKNSIINYY